MKDFPQPVGRFTKTSLPPKKLWQIPVCREDCQIVQICFSPPQTLISWSPLCLFCRSVILRERSHCSTRSTHSIMVQERTAICKSQLEPIIENPSNKWVEETSFWSLIHRLTIPRFSLSATQARVVCVLTRLLFKLNTLQKKRQTLRRPNPWYNDNNSLAECVMPIRMQESRCIYS